MKPPAQNSPPDSWVARYSGLLPPGGTVLDLACGGGRHTRYLLALGHRVVAVDADLAGVADLRGQPRLQLSRHDLETGRWPFAAGTFTGIVVCNYLHRPLFPSLADALAPGGVLIYTTFMQGQQHYGRPRNPEFLLRSGELRATCGALLQELAFAEGYAETPRPVQRQSAVFRKRSEPLG
ncbi:MAG: class I SAM-dependent methyltransferase [Gammaproteobacteria bacterium]|jgi:SAM-dependent methyltransferase|nr:class I SAM-dependent methyltransferase [Gammaproteobacteria bacterium]